MTHLDKRNLIAVEEKTDEISGQLESIDTVKRQSLKLMGGSFMVAAVPSVAMSAMQEHSALPEHHAPAELSAIPKHTASELSIILSVDPEPVVTITNHSDQLIIVRHVYPGLVHTGNKVFDINSLFEGGYHAVDVNSSRRFSIAPLTSRLTEATDFPRERYRNQPIRVAALAASSNQGLLVNSTRSFFS